MGNDRFKIVLNNHFLLPSLFCAFILSMVHNPFTLKTSVTDFTREIGNGLLNNVDVPSIINNIYIHFIIILILTIIFYLFFYIIFNSNFESKKEYIVLINEISIISFPCIVLFYLKRFNEGFSLSMEYILPAMLVCIILVVAVISSKMKTDFETLCWCLISSIPLSFLGFIIINTMGKELNIIAVCLCYLISVIILYFIVSILNLKLSFENIKKAYMIFMCSPIVSLICMEVLNILVKNKIITSSLGLKHKVIFFIYILLFLSSILSYIFASKKHDLLFNKEKLQNFYNIIALLSLAIIWTHLPYQSILETEYFEQANHANAIYGFLKYFQIPMIENFDAHMLSNSIGNLIYGVFNGDSFEAVFIGYSLQPIYIILFYLLFNKFLSQRASFLIMLLFPIFMDYSYSYYAFGVLIILMALYANNRGNFFSYFLFSLCFIVVCFFRLDIGVAFSVSSFLILLIVNIYKKNKRDIRYLVGSMVLLGGLFGVLYFVICFAKNINPLNRVFEFIGIASSNINWGYGSRGDTSLIAYTLCYMLIPMIVFGIILYILYHIFNKNLLIDESKLIALMILGSAYFFNFSRGIVRHSLVENTTTCLISTAILFISLSVCIIKGKSINWFIICELSLLIITNLLLNSHIVNYSTLIGSTSSRIVGSGGLIDDNSGDRVILSDNMKSFYTPIKTVFDHVMDENETYLDFTNQTLLYPLLEREKPVYINQSPGLLSGEYTQEQFINQIENSKNPVNYVLMPLSEMNLAFEIDGIPNSARYYLVTEYICNNYVPLFKNSSFAVWCKKELFNQKLTELEKILTETIDYELDYETIGNVSTNNSIEKLLTDDGIIFNATGPDPQLMGLESYPIVKELLTNSTLIEILINYETNVSGNSQLFYTTDDREGFSEQKSIQQTVAESGTMNFHIPCTKYTKLRLDTPEGSSFKIKSIFIRDLSINTASVNLIDYNYLDINKHIYYLEALPYIWANYDEVDSTNNEVQVLILSDVINATANIPFEIPLAISDIDKEQGNYLLLDITADEAASLQIVLGDKDDVLTPKSIYVFDINVAQHGMYLIRVSSDFMWYSNMINNMQFQADKNVIINSAKIIQGDTLD